MIKWLIIEQQFMTSAKVIEKGFLNEKEAQKISDHYERGSDSYTSYHVQPYQTDNVIEFGNLKLKNNEK